MSKCRNNRFKFLLAIFLMIYSSFTYSQVKYSDYLEKEKESIFFDDFVSNNFGWRDDSKESCNKYVISPGFYELKALCKEKLITSDFNYNNEFVIDTKRDFEIETSYMISKGDPDTYSSIRFGQNESLEKLFSFVYNGNGDFSIKKYDNDWIDLMPWTFSELIKKNNFNKMTIRKIGNKYFFFINESLVFECLYEPFFGQVLTFLTTQKSTMKIDFIKISYLKSKRVIQVDKTPPKITIEMPVVNRGVKIEETSKQIVVKGKVTDNVGVYEVLLNGLEVHIDANGNFEQTVKLAFGENTIEVKATDTKNNSSIETLKVQRQESASDDLSNSLIINDIGKFYALIIGNNKYEDPSIKTLDEPINDANKLYEILTSKYTFEKQNIVKLENAKYVEIMDAFDVLSTKLTKNDNLLVFYAGHGDWVEEKNLGYWLPVDAKKGKTAYNIANSRISDYMNAIKSKHTLLIADACFSGGIFKNRSILSDAQPAITKLYDLSSKKAMTSGNLKEVPDKSVFMKFLVKRLTENTEKYLSSDVLFASFRQAVLNNSQTEPQYGVIQNAGDEGGEFIFVQK